MKKMIKVLTLVVLSLPLAAQAHKQWIVPFKTIVNVDQWVTFDAGVSTDPFVRDNNAARLDNLAITAPDGSKLVPENVSNGKLRATFDLQLKQAGTYKVALVNSSVNASWDDNGQTKRWPARGAQFTAEGFAKEVPVDAKDLKVTQSLSRIETFVTAGKPNDVALKAVGQGLELVQVTGFNDLYVGEPATFQFLLDGKPAANIDVEVIADGTRYRNTINEIELKTDKNGRFTLNWKSAGLYWLSASVKDDKAEKPATLRNVSYAATVEVLSP